MKGQYFVLPVPLYGDEARKTTTTAVHSKRTSTAVPSTTSTNAQTSMTGICMLLLEFLTTAAYTILGARRGLPGIGISYTHVAPEGIVKMFL